MTSLPLRLALEPVLPARFPRDGEPTLEYGYRLRLPDGPAVECDDPLLRAFAAAVERFAPEDDEEDEEPLQPEAFDPGRSLRLTRDPDDDGVDVLDAEDVLYAGTLRGDTGAFARAAIEAGLPMEALALSERRAIRDDRRWELELLVFSPALVTVEPPAVAFTRPARAVRPRLVLFADDPADLRWWDPAAAGGPVDVDSLPFSSDLAARFAALREKYAAHADDGLEGDIGCIVHSHARRSLDDEARRLWHRARVELSRRYTVGYLGPGMRRPIWSTEREEDDDAIPF